MAHLEYSANGELIRVGLDIEPITYLIDDGARLRVASVSEKTLTGFYHSTRFFVVWSLGGAVISVNGCKVTVLKIVREGDRVVIGKITATFRELVTEVLSLEATLVSRGIKCIVCQQLFHDGDLVVYCPSCHTAHHEQCWKWMKGRCANGKVCQYQAPWNEVEVAPA